MKVWQQYLLLTMIATGVLGSVGLSLYKDHQKYQNAVDVYSACDYLGSRMEIGWGGGRIYKYKCNGIIEETRHKYHEEPMRKYNSE